MKLGMYSIELVRPSVEELFSAARRYGYTGMQFDFSSVTGEQMPAAVGPGVLRRTAAASKDSGVVIVAVNGTFNMAHPDAECRREGLERFEVVAEAAKELGCDFLTLCTGSRDPENMWRFHADNDSGAAWEDMLRTMEETLHIAEKSGVLLGIECEASNTVNSPDKARRLLDHFSSPHLRIIIDVANLFHAGQAKQENVRPIIDHAFALLGGDMA